MYTFAGALGLGSTWLNGSCDTACQQRVSSCLLAMANRDGKHVSIELVSAGTGMSTIGANGDDVTYPNQEGSFFGNLFPSPPLMYTSAGAQADRAEQAKRFCVTGTGCDLFTKTAASACTQTCSTGPGGKQVCAAKSCKAPDGTVYNAPITVYLRNRIEAGNFDSSGGSTFGGGVTAYAMAGGTMGIQGLDDEDWVQHSDVQFGVAGSATTFTAYIATMNAGNSIDLRVDSPTGPVISSIKTASTGGWGPSNEQAQSAPIASAGISGKHSVYVTFNGAANRASGANGGGKQIGNISYLEVK
jgi:hypothetical protein